MTSPWETQTTVCMADRCEEPARAGDPYCPLCILDIERKAVQRHERPLPLDRKIDLLDHGFVQLIDWMGNNDSVVRAARVSHAANAKTGVDPEADFKLTDYLYRNGHTSPFEHVTFTFHVKAPIFVFRQWHRHRTWSFNEVSARYTELPEEFYVPDPQLIGRQSKTDHQARDMTMEQSAEMERTASLMRDCNAVSFDWYRLLLNRGVPRELARTVLPVATYSEMYATVDLHNLLKFISERSSEHAQYEIRVYSDAMLELIEPIVPAAVAAWEAHRG